MLLLRIFLYRIIDVYSFLLLIYALLSWFPDAYQSTIGRWVIQIVEPLLKPLRRLNLQFSGLDFTVWFAMFLLNVLKQLL